MGRSYFAIEALFSFSFLIVIFCRLCLLGTVPKLNYSVHGCFEYFGLGISGLELESYMEVHWGKFPSDMMATQHCAQQSSQQLTHALQKHT